MRIIVIVCFFMLPGLQVNSQTFQVMSRAVSDYQLKNGIRELGKDGYNEIRLKLDSLKKMCFVNHSDTLFFLETYAHESGEIHALIWNNYEKLSYQYYQGTFTFNKDLVFSNYMVNLVNSWDIDGIKEEEGENSYMSDNSNVTATRIIKKGMLLEIKCITFMDFFKLPRDRAN